MQVLSILCQETPCLAALVVSVVLHQCLCHIVFLVLLSAALSTCHKVRMACLIRSCAQHSMVHCAGRHAPARWLLPVVCLGLNCLSLACALRHPVQCFFCERAVLVKLLYPKLSCDNFTLVERCQVFAQRLIWWLWSLGLMHAASTSSRRWPNSTWHLWFLVRLLCWPCSVVAGEPMKGGRIWRLLGTGKQHITAHARARLVQVSRSLERHRPSANNCCLRTRMQLMCMPTFAVKHPQLHR